MIHGKNLILTLDGEAIAASKNCEVSVNSSFIDVCAPNGGVWEEKIPTTIGWSVSTSGLVADTSYVDSLLSLQANRTKVTLRFYDTTTGIHKKGDAYVSNVKMSGAVGNLVNMTMDFQPTGALVTDEGTMVDLDILTRESESNYRYNMNQTTGAVTRESDTILHDAIYYSAYHVASAGIYRMKGGILLLHKGTPAEVKALSNANLQNEEYGYVAGAVSMTGSVEKYLWLEAGDYVVSYNKSSIILSPILVEFAKL